MMLKVFVCISRSVTTVPFRLAWPELLCSSPQFKFPAVWRLRLLSRVLCSAESLIKKPAIVHVSPPTPTQVSIMSLRELLHGLCAAAVTQGKCHTHVK